jgi:hypothetical protein
MKPEPAQSSARWVGAWCALCGLLAAWTASVPLGRIPHVSDEVAYGLQAKLFAAGMRTGPAGDNPSMLEMPFWVSAPSSYSPFPPGWPALLSLGERMDLAWLVNPLLVVGIPAIVWGLAREWGGDKVARLAVVIAALSPALWITAGSQMSHTSSVLAVGLTVWVAVRQPESAWWWAIGGLAAAYGALARPMDALIIALPMLLWGMTRAPSFRARLAWIGLPAVGAALFFWDNHALTGSGLRLPMDMWFDRWTAEHGMVGCNQLGFGLNHGCAQTFGSLGHTPLKAAKIIGQTALELDSVLIGVPGAGLLAAFGAWRLRGRWPWLMALALIAAHALYWSPGRAYLARFWHPLLLLLPIAVAAALQHLPRRWVILGLIGAAAWGGSWRMPDLVDRYWCADSALQTLLDEEGISEGVVFVRGKGQRSTAWSRMGVDDFICDPMLEAMDGLRLNDPAHPRSGLRVRHALPSLSATQHFMSVHHPDAPAWLVDHQVSTDAYRVFELQLD